MIEILLQLCVVLLATLAVCVVGALVADYVITPILAALHHKRKR